LSSEPDLEALHLWSMEEFAIARLFARLVLFV